MNFKAELIRESDLAVVRVAYGVTKQDALAAVGFTYQKGFDANVIDVRPVDTAPSSRGLGYFSTYVD